MIRFVEPLKALPVLTPVTELATAYSVGAVAYCESRYPGNAIPSST